MLAEAASVPAHLVPHKGTCQNHQKCLKQCLDQTPAINSGAERERTQLEATMGPNSSRCSITLAAYLATARQCSWWCTHASFQTGFGFPHVVPPAPRSVVLPLPCSHPLWDVLLCRVYFCAICICLQQHASQIKCRIRW